MSERDGTSLMTMPKSDRPKLREFSELGFIAYNGGLTINTWLLNVVLHD
jgi:hypothetical protein